MNNQDTIPILLSHIIAMERFYGTRPENPGLIEIEDLRTEKTRGKCPVTTRFAFNFEGKQDYLDWVKTWKVTMNELVRRVRACSAAYNAGRKRNGLGLVEQAKADQALNAAWNEYEAVRKLIQEAFKTKFAPAKPGTAYGVHFYDHADTARILLSLRKAAKVASIQQKNAALVKVA